MKTAVAAAKESQKQETASAGFLALLDKASS